MAVESRKPLRAGLDLGVEQSQTPGMVLAHGARFERGGETTSRLGRVRMGLEFPDENVGTASDYTETIAHLTRTGRTRGFGAFYDQRVETEPQEVLSETDFTTTTKWAAVNDFAFSGGAAVYTHSAGNGEISQASGDFTDTDVFVASVEYIFEYDLTFTAGTASNLTSLNVNTFIAGVTEVPRTAGHHRVTLLSAASAGNFVLDAVSGGSVTFEIDNVSLKRKVTTLTLPARLNIVAKGADGTIFLNNNFVGDGTGVLVGKGQFTDTVTRAKIVSTSDRCFIVDPSARPRAMRRLPIDDQDLYKRVKYDIRDMGIRWPRFTSQVPKLSLVSASGDGLPIGAYRVRVSLENEIGDESSPSLTAYQLSITGTQDLEITLPPIPQDLQTTENDVTKWRIYISYQAGELSSDQFKVIENEPSAFRFWKSVDISTTTEQLSDDDFERLDSMPALQPRKGAPPKLLDFIVVNDTSYGIANYDTVFRESLITDGRGRVAGFSTVESTSIFGLPFGAEFGERVFDFTEIKESSVDPSYLFIGEPGNPQYMNNFVRFSEGDEIGVALSHIGGVIVIFTNKGILLWDPAELRLKRTPSEVGALARDSVQRTERGIRFMGSDGVPRIFNGATVDEVADELMPIFDQEDFKGSYLRFDPKFAHEVSTASGERTFYMNYPVSSNPGKFEPGQGLDTGGNRNLAVGDASQGGRTVWSVDKTGYEQILWLGREGRLLAANFKGEFYYIEEGLADQQVTGTKTPVFDWVFRWYGGETQRETRFHAVRIEMDTRGISTGVILKVDDDSDLVTSFTISESGRKQYRRLLPATFKGLYLEVRMVGTTDATKGRPKLYDIQVESTPVGVF